MSAVPAFRWLVLSVEAILALPIGYLCIVSLAALFAAAHQQRRPKASRDRRLRFGILIPAHDEVAVLGGLLATLDRIKYPRTLYEVHVVADNCTDRTAALARAAGDWVHVHERFDRANIGKGQALAWLLRRLASAGIQFDAYVIVDADSTLDPSFLSAMNDALLGGARATQGRQIVSNAHASRTTALRSVALALMNYVRPLGRTALGSSSTLCGNGICLSHQLLQDHPWTAMSTAEDYEYYLHLVSSGERVWFVPEAVLASSMPVSFAGMTTQEIRWSGGVGFTAKLRRVSTLLGSAAANRSLVPAEAAVEFMTPSLTFLVAGSLSTLIAAVGISSLPGACISVGLLAGIGWYIGTGIYLSRLPPEIWLALVHAPFFVLWKAWVHLVVRRMRKETTGWIRTDRAAG
jgi:cellulose synthase/poly-beta-1,6-N-acetylglucosamine synthase-like glycosyltransferase